MVTNKATRAVAYIGNDGGVLNGKAYGIMKAGARKWAVEQMKEKTERDARGAREMGKASEGRGG